ncbi:MAG: hypothetical protein NTV80_12205 [Verrucomicrobia bacterium]|nr:hypothetical protein [Verrucomicrobiota bacterium]
MKSIVQSLRSISGFCMIIGLFQVGLVNSAMAQAAAANAPKLTTTVQASSAPGAVIQVNGTNLNRGSSGAVWNGQPPYVIQMTGQNGQPINASFTFINATRLNVVVPNTAISSRIRLVQGGYSSLTNRSFRVTRPLPVGKGLLTIDNLSQYNIVGVQVNGVEQLPANIGFLVKTAGELPLNPGQHQVKALLGINSRPNFLFFSTVNVTMVAGARLVFNVNRITVPQLMTNFSTLRDWNSDLILGNEGAFHVRSVRFFAGGTYQLRELRPGNVVVTVENSTYSELSWPDNSLSISFRLGNRTVSLLHPFASFLSNVGRNNQTLLLTRQ